MQKVAGTVPVVLYFTLTDDERFYDVLKRLKCVHVSVS